MFKVNGYRSIERTSAIVYLLLFSRERERERDAVTERLVQLCYAAECHECESGWTKRTGKLSEYLLASGLPLASSLAFMTRLSYVNSCV